MWEDFSTRTTWQCNDCNYTSDYPMATCLDCDSTYISKHTVDHSGGEREWERKEEDEDDQDDQDEDNYTTDQYGRRWR